jgi:hypothetical protein
MKVTRVVYADQYVDTLEQYNQQAKTLILQD